MVLPRTWDFEEQAFPADVNRNFQAAALALNHVHNDQVVAAAGIPGSRFTTVPGRRVTGAQSQNAQITEPKLADESVFFRSTAEAAGAVTTLTTTKTELARVTLALDGGELVFARVWGIRVLPFDASGYVSTARFELEVTGLPLIADKFLTVARPGSAGGPTQTFTWAMALWAIMLDVGTQITLPVMISGKEQASTPGQWDVQGVDVQVMGAL